MVTFTPTKNFAPLKTKGMEADTTGGEGAKPIFPTHQQKATPKGTEPPPISS